MVKRSRNFIKIIGTHQIERVWSAISNHFTLVILLILRRCRVDIWLQITANLSSLGVAFQNSSFFFSTGPWILDFKHFNTVWIKKFSLQYTKCLICLNFILLPKLTWHHNASLHYIAPKHFDHAFSTHAHMFLQIETGCAVKLCAFLKEDESIKHYYTDLDNFFQCALWVIYCKQVTCLWSAVCYVLKHSVNGQGNFVSHIIC